MTRTLVKKEVLMKLTLKQILEKIEYYKHIIEYDSYKYAVVWLDTNNWSIKGRTVLEQAKLEAKVEKAKENMQKVFLGIYDL